MTAKYPSDEKRMKLKDGLLELFFPSRCAFCRKITDCGEQLCRECAGKLPYTEGSSELQFFKNIDGCVSPLFYEGTVRESLLRYKFGGCAAYGTVYGKLIAKCIDENSISCDIITWVPLSRRRLRKRGYDQARLIAESVAGELKVPCEKLLVKLRDNPAQSGAGNMENRRKNVSGVYGTVNEELFYGKRVLLTDDIVTTGSTLSECASMLKKAGAAAVYAAAAARKKD